MRTHIQLIAVTIAALGAPATIAIGDAMNSVTHAANPHNATGSWLETVTFPPETGRPPLQSLVTFHADGTMTCSDQGSVTISEPSVFTPCHGVWVRLEKRDVAYTQVSLISDLSGNLVGYLKVRGIYTVTAAGHEYTGTSLAQIVDIDGHVQFQVQVANSGRRIAVELP